MVSDLQSSGYGQISGVFSLPDHLYTQHKKRKKSVKWMQRWNSGYKRWRIWHRLIIDSLVDFNK